MITRKDSILFLKRNVFKCFVYHILKMYVYMQKENQVSRFLVTVKEILIDKCCSEGSSVLREISKLLIGHKQIYPMSEFSKL